MKSIEANGYRIFFNENDYSLLNQFLLEATYSTIFILVDENTNEYCLPKLLANLAVEVPIEIIEIESGELNKNSDTCLQIWNVLTELGADRKSVLLNLGGGVISDLGGFVASTFKRGIDFINIPTTLLAMVDASVGGKTGINLGILKNQIGVFSNPKTIWIDCSYLTSLPSNEMRSGLAEMLKHGLTFDKNYWEKFLSMDQLNLDDLESLIYRSIQIKNEIVIQDPTEKGIRKALNFGHTLGHALESYFLKNKLLHGEAIAIGLVLESHISWQKNRLKKEEYLQIKKTVQSIFEPIIINSNDVEAVIELLIHDKKNEFGMIQFTLINGIGSFVLNQEVENQLIIEAFNDYKL
jgi:3-dehydroquinate synthase